MRKLSLAAAIAAIALLLCGFAYKGARSYAELAQMFVAQGRYDDAVTFFDKAIAMEPKNPELYQHRAFFYLKLERFDLGLRDLTTVIELQPDKAEGYLSRGLVHSDRNQRGMAEADFRKACELGDTSGCAFLTQSERQP